MVNRPTLEESFQREDEENRNAFLAEALGTYAGRKFLWWLLGITGSVGNGTFALDPYLTAFNCGKQDIGNQVLGQIAYVNGGALGDMMKEMGNERTERDSRLRDARGDHADGSSGGGDPYAGDTDGYAVARRDLAD